jgi:hypothetical protein
MPGLTTGVSLSPPTIIQLAVIIALPLLPLTRTMFPLNELLGRLVKSVF